MATQVQVPALGESVKQAVLVRWHKADGEAVAVDEPICELETDKANVDLPAPAAGVLRRVKDEGDTVNVGEVIARIDPAAVGAEKGAKTATTIPSPAQSSSSPTARATVPSAPDLSPAVRRIVEENRLDPTAIPATGPGGRLSKEDVLKHMEQRAQAENGTPAGSDDFKTRPLAPESPATKQSQTEAKLPASPQMDFDAQGIRRVPMSKIRRRIAERLVSAQQTAAILTTFNEIDLSTLLDLRGRYKERFAEVHGVSLGLMSFFARACVLALKEFPRVNASIEGDDVIYHQHVHLGIAVSTDRGLAVPVLRHVEKMSFAHIEAEIKRLANSTRDGKLGLEELTGGTFTITNGGVFGSLLSTPIINPPQSGILGMHAIQKRPIAVNDKVEIRPMMYVALSYDHRLVDGKESVSFLVRLKQLLEDPARLMLEI